MARAPDNFSRLRGKNRNLSVQSVRNRDIHNVDVGTRNSRSPIRTGFFPAPLLSKSVELIRVAGTNDLRIQFEGRVKKAPDLMKSIGVGTSDETAPDHSNIQLFLMLSHFFVDRQNIRPKQALDAQTFALQTVALQTVALQTVAPWSPAACS